MRHAAWALLVPLFATACGSPDGEPATHSGEGLLRLKPGPVVFDLVLPHGSEAADVVLGAKDSLQIRDRVTVKDALITSRGRTEIGVDSAVDDVVSVNDVTLRDRASAGDIVTGGRVHLSNHTSTGVVDSYASLDSDAHLELEFIVPEYSSGHLTVRAGQSMVLAPNRYDSITVDSGGHLEIPSGVTFVDRLTLRPGSNVDIDDENGTVVLVVSQNLTLRGNLHDTYSESEQDLLIAFSGQNWLTLDSPFDGFFVAPKASVRLAGNHITHRGSFFAKYLEVSPSVTVEHRSFDAGEHKRPEVEPLDLSKHPLPDVSKFVKDSDKLKVLGKALFWDVQVGVDGQACASCHYSAGADMRVKNQVSPGLRDEHEAPMFDLFATGPAGPNYTLSRHDFPLRKLSDPSDRKSSVIHHAGNDVVSSMGTFRADIDYDTDGTELCLSEPDALFNVDGDNTRRVEPRNTPTTINAVFNFRNFWDGRANNVFNGMNPFGRRDPVKRILKAVGSDLVDSRTSRSTTRRLASQAAGPPLSDLRNELWHRRRRASPSSGDGCSTCRLSPCRTSTPTTASWPRTVPPLAAARTYTYRELVEMAFEDKFWDSATLTSDGLSLMENNFSLFFGLAVQAYETELVSDDTRFDDYARGYADSLSASEARGLRVFLGKGKCVNCHSGPEFSGAASELFKENEEEGLVERMEMAVGVALYDGGFYNIGATPTVEDIGVGGEDPWGNPLSFTRQEKDRAAGDDPKDPFETDPHTFEADPGVPVSATERDAVDGAFKTPILRNIALTGPYMHNGGHATLREVVEFYNRGGDRLSKGPEDCDNTGFGPNCNNLDPDIRELELSNKEIDDLVAFMEALTDDRVRDESGPFDHPSLPLVVGHVGDTEDVSASYGVCDDEMVVMPAVGKHGRQAMGLPQIPTFEDMLDCVNGDSDASVLCFGLLYGAY